MSQGEADDRSPVQIKAQAVLIMPQDGDGAENDALDAGKTLAMARLVAMICAWKGRPRVSSGRRRHCGRTLLEIS